MARTEPGRKRDPAEYDFLCDLCGVDGDKCEDTQDLMDKCLAEIEKEEAEAKKK